MANRKVSPLTDTEIRNAKPREKKYSIPDGNGLQLTITPDGRRFWEIRYTVDGKARQTTAGTYPAVTLKEARAKRDELRGKISDGIDPIIEKKEAKKQRASQTEAEAKAVLTQFHNVFYEWIDTFKKSADITISKRKRAFERDIFPYFCTYDENHRIASSKQIDEITHGELLRVITEKGKTAAETANRLFGDCNRLWTYAVSHEYTDLNICIRIDKSVVPKGEKVNLPKITDEKILGQLMRSIEQYHGEGGVIVRNLLRFVSIIPLRADNLCKLRWDQIDFEKAIITIPRTEMKVKNRNLPDFVIPLPHQAAAILEDVKPFTVWGQWVFHGLEDIKQHVNKESGNKALRIMGYTDEAKGRKQTLHSFRGTFRSLTETYAKDHKASFEVRERCLDHHEKKEAVRAYIHKADYTEQMRELFQWWADYLDEVRNNEPVN